VNDAAYEEVLAIKNTNIFVQLPNGAVGILSLLTIRAPSSGSGSEWGEAPDFKLP